MTISGSQWNKLGADTRRIILRASGHFDERDIQTLSRSEWRHIGDGSRAEIKRTCKGLRCKF